MRHTPSLCTYTSKPPHERRGDFSPALKRREQRHNQTAASRERRVTPVSDHSIIADATPINTIIFPGVETPG